MNTFTLTFDHHSKQPLYQQLYAYLVAEIQSGRLQANEKLPGKKALAKHLCISQSTIETAYEMLCAEGYLTARPRSGFYVCQVERLPQLSQPLPPPQPEPVKGPQPTYELPTHAVDTSAFPYLTWAKIAKETMYHHPELLRPGHRQGDENLRQSLAKYLHEFRGVHCRPEQIIIGAGLEYLLDLVCQLLGEEAIFALENPGYQKTYHILANNGRQLVFLPVDEGGMELQALQDSPANVAYITPSHQFPLGVIMPIGRRLQLLKWAGAAPGRYLIEDDYDSEFRYSGRPIPALQGLDQQHKVIYTGTFSRSIAPSIRVAYVVLPPDLLAVYQTKFDFYSSTVSRMEQQILHRFLAEGHFTRHLNKVRNLYRQRKEAFLQGLAASSLAAISQVQGENAGLHFLLTVQNGQTEEELIQRALAQDLGVSGLSAYYFVPPAQPRPATLVLGFADLDQATIPIILQKMEQAWLPAR